MKRLFNAANVTPNSKWRTREVTCQEPISAQHLPFAPRGDPRPLLAAVATLLWRTQLVSAGPSLGSWVLVSVLGLCVVQRAAEELVLPSASERSKEEKQETGRCPKDTSWTRLGTRVLPLDLIPTSSEVACGQQLIAVEGFPPSERTESRSLPRRVWASERLSGGGREEEEKSALNCETRRIFPLSQCCRDVAPHGSNILCFIRMLHFPHLCRSERRNRCRQR